LTVTNIFSKANSNVKMFFFGNEIFFTDQNNNTVAQIGNLGIQTNQTYQVQKDITTSALPQALYSTAYNNANAQTAQLSFYRLRGTVGNALPVANGDYVMHMPCVAYIDSGNTFSKVADLRVEIQDTDQAGTYSGRLINDVRGANSKIINLAQQSVFTLDTGTYSPNATIYGNGYINTNNRIEYLRTYGSFLNGNDIAITANTVANLDLPTTSSANGISITSNNQITIARAGTYNFQFSLQLTNSDNASEHEFDVWFAKNGTDIADSATSYTVIKNNGKNVAALNFIDTCSANDYYQIRYAASSANISLEAFANITTPYTRPAIPSAIVTVVPVGA